MSLSLSAKQTAFFKTNGHLELEAFLSLTEAEQLHASLLTELDRRKKSGHPFPNRDLWRSIPALQTLLLSRKCTQTALELSHAPYLRVGFDHWIDQTNAPQKMQELSSIQGITCAFLFRLSEAPLPPLSNAPIGLNPFPQSVGNALLIQPSLFLNWPKIPFPPLYLITYSLPSAVYVQNPKDPNGTYLKTFGYGYGDPLSNKTHPLFFTNR